MILFGYYTNYGYRGYVNGQWILFSTEREYTEYVEELEEDRCTSQTTT